MKVEITPDGDLVIEPENNLEAFALRTWSKLHHEHRASFIVKYNRRDRLDDALDYMLNANENDTAGDLRCQIVERFGADIDEELQRRFNQTVDIRRK